jgi:hypothetical protein
MRTITATTLLAAAACAPLASGQEGKGITRILLDRALQERRVLITELNPGTVTYMEGSLVRTEPTGEYLAILPVPSVPEAKKGADPYAQKAPPERISAPAPGMMLELIDGQVLTGSLAGASPSGDSFTWSHRALGPVQLKVDHLHRLRVAPGAPNVDAPAANDLIVFVNGDRMEAFVEVLADPVVASAGEQKHTIPVERIAQVVFANPTQEPEGAFAWLTDGSVVGVREIRTTRIGELLLRPRLSGDSESPEMGAGSPSIPLNSIAGMVFDVSALRPLAGIEPGSQQPGGGRRWAPPVQVVNAPGPLGAADVLIPGPMTVRWAIPDSMTRLVADAELPRESWTWGDLELVVSVASGAGSRELSRTRLNADAPAFRLVADLGTGPGRTLEIRVEPGEHGPVQDRVLLKRPLLAAAAGAN